MIGATCGRLILRISSVIRVLVGRRLARVGARAVALRRLPVMTGKAGANQRDGSALHGQAEPGRDEVAGLTGAGELTGDEGVEFDREGSEAGGDERGEPLARPSTLLIDSEQLESGEALEDNFRAMAASRCARPASGSPANTIVVPIVCRCSDTQRAMEGIDPRSPQGIARIKELLAGDKATPAAASWTPSLGS